MKVVDSVFAKMAGQEMEQVASMLMSASLLRTTATRTPSALTPKDRFRAGADLVTKAMVLNVFLMVLAKV